MPSLPSPVKLHDLVEHQQQGVQCTTNILGSTVIPITVRLLLSITLKIPWYQEAQNCHLPLMNYYYYYSSRALPSSTGPRGVGAPEPIETIARRTERPPRSDDGRRRVPLLLPFSPSRGVHDRSTRENHLRTRRGPFVRSSRGGSWPFTPRDRARFSIERIPGRTPRHPKALSEREPPLRATENLVPGGSSPPLPRGGPPERSGSMGSASRVPLHPVPYRSNPIISLPGRGASSTRGKPSPRCRIEPGAFGPWIRCQPFGSGAPPPKPRRPPSYYSLVFLYFILSLYCSLRIYTPSFFFFFFTTTTSKKKKKKEKKKLFGKKKEGVSRPRRDTEGTVPKRESINS